MTLTSCALAWTSGQYNWCSKAAGSVGLRIDEAFSAFAAAVNPNNPSHPLAVLKNHNSATGTTSFGYVWQLGHPSVPIVLGFWNTTLAQGNSSSSSSATLRLALQSAYTADSANAGYGTFASTILAGSRGLTHYTPAAGATPVISTLAGWLGIAFDDTPGAEWFLWAHGPNYTDLYTANFVGLLLRTENGWALCIYRGQAYLGQAQTWDRYMVLNGTLTLMAFPSMPTGLIQQVRNGLHLVPNNGFLATGTYLVNGISQRPRFPDCLYAGNNQISTPARLLAKAHLPAGGGGTRFYQLGGSSSSAVDLWYREEGTPQLLSGWGSWESVPFTLYNPGVDSTPLAFCEVPSPATFTCGPTGLGDFINEWGPSAMGLPGVEQHPLWKTQVGGSGGGSARPGSGILWPRGTR
jgi:hypothetical protein